MDLKKILETKEALKEKLAEYQLQTGFLDEFAKEYGNRSSAQQIMLMQLSEKIYSMTENDLLAFFDKQEHYCVVNPVFKNIGEFVGFEGIIYDKIGAEIYITDPNPKTRNECLEKTILACIDLF